MTSKGYKHTPEAIEKIRKASKARYEAGQCEKFKQSWGRKHTEEAKAKISKAQKGAGNSMYGKTNEKSPHWKGDDVGYYGIHDWLTANYGQPKFCENCGNTDPSKRYEWSAIDGVHKRDRNQYRRLCKKCHNDYDGVNVWQQS